MFDIKNYVDNRDVRYAWFNRIKQYYFISLSMNLSWNFCWNLVISSSTSRINSFLRNFSHSNEQLHNDEIKEGADVALYRLLLCLVTNGSGNFAIDTPLNCLERKRQIISSVCRAFAMVYQCSTEMAETSFRHIGSELLDLLSVVLIAQLNAHCIHDDHVMSSSSKCDEHSVPMKTEMLLSNLWLESFLVSLASNLR